MEIWKETHEKYKISNYGRLFSLREKELKLIFISGGLAATVSVQGKLKCVRISRLVGEAFCNDYRKNRYPIYIDGNRYNNSSTNLKWVSRKEVCGHPYSKNKKVL
jgi:hypothetical protein